MDKPSEQTELRILLLEDVPTDAELAEEALREAGLSFTARRVDTREAFVRALEEFKPDIVLADYKLPAFDGGSAVEMVRQQYPTVPVVMVTGAMGDDKAVELLKLGARDYVLKDRLARLGSAVHRALSEERGIRNRKAAEQALRESEAKLRAVLETTSDWLWETDEQGVYTYASPVVHDLLGYMPEELTGKTPFDLMTAEEAARVSAIFGAIAAEQRPFQLLENICLHKDGHAVVMETSGVPVFDGNGVFRGFRGIDRDITGRRKLEDALREAADRNRIIMETANDAIICMKPDGVVHLWNHKAEELFGYTAGEAIGQNLHQLIVPERYREKTLAGLRQFAKTGAGPVVGKTLELTALRKGGAEFPIELSISPMNIRGEWHATGIIRDTTGRKQTEARLNEQLEELRRWNEATLGREMRIMEVKHEVNELLKQAGQPPRYPSAEQPEAE